MDFRAVIAALSRLLPLGFSIVPTPTALKSWFPFTESTNSDSTTTSTTEATPQSNNPLRILWQYWLNASFLTNVTIGALFVLVVVAVVGGVVVLETDTTLTQQTESDMRHSSSLQHSQTDLWVSSMKRQSELISNSQVVTEGTNDEIDQYLDQQLRNLPTEAVSIHYVQLEQTDQASVIESTGENAGIDDAPWNQYRPSDFSDRESVRQTVPYTYTTDSTGYGGDTPVLAFVTPSHSSNDKAIVIVVNLRESSERLNAPDNGRSFVVDHDGTIVLSTHPRDVGQNAYSNGYLKDDLWMQAHSETSAYATTYYDGDTEIDDERYVTSMAHTDQADWVAYTQVPHSDAFSLRNNIQNSMLYLIAGVLISVTIVGAVVGIPTVRDLRRLSRTTQRVSDGNYDDPITADRDDEVGQVFADVDEMRASLRDRIHEVEELNDKLQRIVQEQSDVMAEVADGDLTKTMTTNTGLPALDKLAEDFNDMVEDVRQMVIEIEQSEEEMEQLMFIATHDLREPLRMIDTYIDLLEMEYGDEAALDEEAEEYMGFITNSSKRIDAMIEDLYAYLRAKTHDNEYADHNLAEIVETAQTEIEDEISESNADITVDSLPTAHVDERQLREVFVNLISNAIEYAGDERPEIEISGKTNERSEEHIISIEDNGIGIPENQYEKIFEVFSRVERDDNDTGTGIGLAICKRIVEDHDGRIWVESMEGEGTTFNIVLPFEVRTMQEKFRLDRDDQGTDLNLDETTD